MRSRLDAAFLRSDVVKYNYSTYQKEHSLSRWRTWEITYLHDHCNDGAEAIAEHLGRTISSVQVMASRLCVSLRPSWYCPRCGHVTYMPLSTRTGWCRGCTVDEQRRHAQDENVRIRALVAAEEARVDKALKARQAVYSDTTRQRAKLCRLRES